MAYFIPWNISCCTRHAMAADTIMVNFAQMGIRPCQIADFFCNLFHVSLDSHKGHPIPFALDNKAVLEQIFQLLRHDAHHVVEDKTMVLVDPVRKAKQNMSGQSRMSFNICRLLCSLFGCVGSSWCPVALWHKLCWSPRHMRRA